mgnify:CR=1 FL=1
MEPIKVNELPIEYKIDKELLKLLSEANEKYGEYKTYLKNIDFDSRYFLDSIILLFSTNTFPETLVNTLLNVLVISS